MSVRLTVISLAALLAAVGCGDDDKDNKGPSDGGGGNTGWTAAVGADGTLLQTYDDEHWVSRSVADLDLFGVTCVGSEYGWAVGELGHVLHSADSGSTWATQATGTSATLRGIRIAHGNGTHNPASFVGLTAGDEGVVLVTRNGGTNWDSANFDPPTDLSNTDFKAVAVSASGRVLLAVGEAGSVARSGDAGLTFTLSHISGASDLLGVSSDAAGYRTLVVDSAGHVFESADAGTQWTLAYDAKLPLSSVSVSSDASRAVVAGPAGTLLTRSPDGSWQRHDVGSGDLFATLISHDRSRMYVAGENGSVLVSTDQGEAWSNIGQAGPTLFALEDVAPH